MSLSFDVDQAEKEPELPPPSTRVIATILSAEFKNSNKDGEPYETKDGVPYSVIVLSAFFDDYGSNGRCRITLPSKANPYRETHERILGAWLRAFEFDFGSIKKLMQQTAGMPEDSQFRAFGEAISQAVLKRKITCTVKHDTYGDIITAELKAPKPLSDAEKTKHAYNRGKAKAVMPDMSSDSPMGMGGMGQRYDQAPAPTPNTDDDWGDTEDDDVPF